KATTGWLPRLVDAVTAVLPALEAALAGRVADYVVDLVNQLGRGGLPQSPRRARLLARAVIAVHAARAALAGTAPEALHDLDVSAEIAVAAALPQTAGEVPPSPATIRAARRPGPARPAAPAGRRDGGAGTGARDVAGDQRHLARHPATGEEGDALARAYLLGGFPDLWAGHDWRDALAEFRRDLDRFGLTVNEGSRP